MSRTDLDAAVEITVATLNAMDIRAADMNASGAKKVAEFFEVIYDKVSEKTTPEC